MLLGEDTQHSMSTKRGRVRRHSISSLEEAAKRVAQENAIDATTPGGAATIMPSRQNELMMMQIRGASATQQDEKYYNARKRPLPLDASDTSPAKKIALLGGGVTMEELLRNAQPAAATTSGDEPQHLCLPSGKNVYKY